MPLLRPSDYVANLNLDEIEESNLDFIENDVLNEVLSDAGLVPQNKNDSVLKRALDSSGASIENASRTIASVMMTGKYENSKLKAAELVLDLHGIREKDGRVNKQPIFHFIIKDPSININQIFAPVRYVPNEQQLLSENEICSDNVIEGEVLE